MRVHHPILLIAVLASIDTTISTSDSTAFSAQLFPTEQRFLKYQPDVEDDERVINFADIIRKAGTVWDDVLQTNQINGMLKQQTDASKAFAIFKVDKVTGNLFESPEWKLWTTYMIKLAGSEADEKMAVTLLGHLKAEKMATVLAEAAKNPNTREWALRLEDAQVNWWTRFKPDDIFETLKLNNRASDVFDSPQLAMYDKYLAAYNKKNLGTETTLVEVFKKSYGEDDLLKLLLSADGVESKLAIKMVDEMMDGWLEFTQTPYSVFKVLKLNEVSDDLLSSPLLNLWVKYLGQFNEKLPTKKTTMIETFLKVYGDEALTKILEAAKKVPSTEKIATNLETAKTALFQKWMVEGVTPDHLFKAVLKIDPTTMATNPNTNIWRAYYNAYDKANPGKLFSFNP